MPSFKLNNPLQSPGPLSPGQSQGFFSFGLGETSVVAVTAVPPARATGAALAIENLRIVATKDELGDPIHHVLYNVKNVGSVTVPSYKVNVAIFSP